MEIVDASTGARIGRSRESWCSGKVHLRYPIAEGSMAPWPGGAAAYLRIRGKAGRPGLFWYFVNACCQDAATSEWRWDPERFLLDIDQRGERTYCGVIRCVQ